jgi:hypothetical protein
MYRDIRERLFIYRFLAGENRLIFQKWNACLVKELNIIGVLFIYNLYLLLFSKIILHTLLVGISDTHS